MNCTAEALLPLMERDLGPERIAHCLRVAELAAELCRVYGLEQDKGELAGLAHDWAREMPPGSLRALAFRDGAGESLLEARFPVLLHGRAAAVALRENQGIKDPQILEAVACHVTGCPGMGRLAKIVFAADFLEPGRKFIPERTRRGVLRMDVDGMTVFVLEKIFDYLRSTGRPIARPAVELAEELL